MKANVLILSVCSFFIGQIKGQWAGATSDSEIQRVVTPNNQNNRVNSSDKNGRLTIGLGLGGYANALCEAALPITSDIITQYTSNPDPSGFNFFMNGMSKTSYRNLWVGFEWGVGYASKTVEYDYYSTWSGSIFSTSYDIDYLHMGLGIPLRYYFKESQDLDLYAQGVFGYGIIGDVTNDEDILGIFYGGGAIGARFTVLFAELGYNSTGYLRFGLSIPTNK